MSGLAQRLLSSTALVIKAPTQIRVGPNELFKTIQAAVDYAARIGENTVWIAAPGVCGHPFKAPLGGSKVGAKA